MSLHQRCLARFSRSFHLVSSFSRLGARSLSLRPYQEACVQAVLDHLRAQPAIRRLGVSSPTGSGKTVMFTALIQRLHQENPRDRYLILTPSIQIAKQTHRRISELLPQMFVELEQGKSKACGFAQVTVATIQTIHRPDRLRKYDSSTFGAVIVDEAHHSCAQS